VTNIHSEATKAKRLIEAVREMLGPDDDLNEVLANTIEGETQLLEVIDRLVLEAQLAESYADAIKPIKADLDSRKARHEERANRLRQSIASVWADVGPRDKAGKLEAIKRPGYTLSFPWQSSKLVINDVELLPADCVTTETKVIKKANLEAINAKLDAKETVPGTHMSNGYQGISVRVK
jgi:hypothetical protein